MKYIRIFILAFCLAGTLVSCVKNSIPPVKPVAPDFDWKTTRVVSIDVPAETPAKSSFAGNVTKVMVYLSPLFTRESLVASGYATAATSFKSAFDVAKSQEGVYVKTISPEGLVRLSCYDVTGTKAFKNSSVSLIKGLTKAGSLMPVPEVPEIRIPSENEYNVVVRKPGDLDLKQNTTYLIPRGMEIEGGNQTLGGPWISDAFSVVPMVCVAGKLKFVNAAELRNCRLVVLKGGEVEFSKGATFTAGSSVYVMNEGELEIKGVFDGTATLIVNHGDFKVTGSSGLHSSSVLYNTGEAEFHDLEINGGQIVNWDEFEADKFKMTDAARFYNAGGGETEIETELDINGGSSVWVYRDSEFAVNTLKGSGNSTIYPEGGSYMQIAKFGKNQADNIAFINPNEDGGLDYALVYWGLKNGQDDINIDKWENITFKGNIECVYPPSEEKCLQYTRENCNDRNGTMLPAYWTADPKHKPEGGADDEDISYSPAKGIWGTYAFEDLWPYTGDYDMNDAVLDYQVVYYHPEGSNGSLVKSMEFKWSLRAAGTGYKLSMGVQLDKILPSQVASIGNSHKNLSASGPIGGYVTGLEEGQRLAVFPLFNDPKELFGRSTFINTEPGPEALPVKEYSVKIDFTAPVHKENLTIDCINVFLVVSDIKNPSREKEIHLKGFKSTDKANAVYFHMGFAGGQNGDPYTATNNMVWGIQIPERFIYPQERRTITGVYRNFENWYNSAGTAYQDWYKGDRDESALYPLLEKEKPEE